MKRITIPIGLGDSPPTATLLYGQDVRTTLRELPEASVHMVCTSPPYWGLRDYGRDGQIGLEQSPEEFVSALVEVFREVKRVLRPDGTLWVNLGDSYSAGGGFYPDAPSNQARLRGEAVDGLSGSSAESFLARAVGQRKAPPGLKPKDLVGIPWMTAFALRTDGWFLRQDIVWAKDNPMPESVEDRCTRAHEFLFMFAHPASRGRYYYDKRAILEPFADERNGDSGVKTSRVMSERLTIGGQASEPVGSPSTPGKNKRSVWAVNPKPYSGAHFAVWPPALVQPMIRAGTSEYGVCKDCGAPWARVLASQDQGNAFGAGGGAKAEQSEAERLAGGVGRMDGGRRAVAGSTFNNNPNLRPPPPATLGWEPTCMCSARAVTRATVLDPFSGSATTGMVATQEGRSYVGIDLNEDYLELAKARVQDLPAPSKDAEYIAELDFFGD
jgi:DNA modification methylase